MKAPSRLTSFGGRAMRFGELRGLSTLPVKRLVEQFRNEDVLTVLPVRGGASALESLLVATPTALAVLTSLPGPPGQWMTRWAPWDSVRVSQPPAPPGQPPDVARLEIHVGGQVFLAWLQGEAGRRALRDFVVAVRSPHRTPSATR
jgi:hypothetical protein